MTKSGSHPVFHRCSDGKMRRTYNANYMRRIGWLRLSCPICDFDKVYVNVMAANRPEAVRDIRKALCERRAIINGRYVKAQRSGNLHKAVITGSLRGLPMALNTTTTKIYNTGDTNENQM